VESGYPDAPLDVLRIAAELRERLERVRRAWAQYDAAGEVSQEALDFEARL
jgi:hypothetical protein